MSTLYERIQTLCKERGVSGSRMCLDLGMSKSTLTSLKQGRTQSISLENAKKIADYFKVPVDVITGGIDVQDGIKKRARPLGRERTQQL